MPDMQIRNAAQINQDLGNFAITGGMSQIPVYSYDYQFMNPNDTIWYQSCPYLNSAYEYNYSLNETWESIRD